MLLRRASLPRWTQAIALNPNDGSAYENRCGNIQVIGH
jgi:hypothetical protein